MSSVRSFSPALCCSEQYYCPEVGSYVRGDVDAWCWASVLRVEPGSGRGLLCTVLETGALPLHPVPVQRVLAFAPLANFKLFEQAQVVLATYTRRWVPWAHERCEMVDAAQNVRGTLQL